MPSFNSGEQSSVYARLDVTVLDSDTASNSSRVKLTGYMVAPRSGYFSGAQIWAGIYSDGSLVVEDLATRTLPTGGSVAVIDAVRTIAHTEDGSKRANISVNVVSRSPGTITFNQWAGGDVDLPKLTRATTPSFNTSLTTEQSVTISLASAVSSYRHDVTWAFGNKTGSIAQEVASSTVWKPPRSMLDQIPNAASGVGTIYVVTKNGNTEIGRRGVNFTLTADSGVTPNISAVVWDDQNTTVKSNIGAFVQGLSLLKGAVTAAGVYGATLTSKRLMLGDQPFPEGQLFQVSSSGTVTASGEATDSRGRTATRAANFTVLPYEPPTLGSGGWQVSRANASNVADENGQYLRLDLHVLAKSLKVGTAEKNALTIAIRTRASDSGWTNRNTITPGLTQSGAIQISGGAVFLASKSYEIEVSISDRTGIAPIVLRTKIGTTVKTVHLNGNSVGIGKLHERGTLDVGGDAYAINFRADQEVYAGGAVLCPIGAVIEWWTGTPPPGWLLLQGQTVSRTQYAALFALWGTTFNTGGESGSVFRLPDHRGRAGVGVSSDTEFNGLGKKSGTKTHTLTTSELPSGVLGVNATNPGFAGEVGSLTSGGGSFGAVGRNSGAGQPHSNIQPSIATHFIVRAL